MEYAVSAGNRQVGKVSLLREGLYYRVLCHAELYGSIMYRLVAAWEGGRVNVGILAPMDGGYGLSRKIPCKYLPEPEKLEFLLLPSHETAEGQFVPISPEEPFAYLQKLQDAYLQRRNGTLGIVIPQ